MTMYRLFEQKLKLMEEQSDRELTTKAITSVLRDCQPWIRESQGKVVYRGSSDKGKIARVPVRKDRRPRDSDEVFHDVLKDIMKRSGKSAGRENSIFVTSSLRDAGSFARGDGARSYIAFPIGDFKYSWSTAVKDTANMERLRDNVAMSIVPLVAGGYPSPFDKFNQQFVKHFESEIQGYMTQARADAQQLVDRAKELDAQDQAASEENEPAVADRLRERTSSAKSLLKMNEQTFVYQFVHGKKFLRYDLLGMDEEKWDRIFEEFDERFRNEYYKAVAATYKGDDGSLPEAIESKHELMIECDEVYLISRQILAEENWHEIFSNNHDAESYLAQFKWMT